MQPLTFTLLIFSFLAFADFAGVSHSIIYTDLLCRMQIADDPDDCPIVRLPDPNKVRYLGTLQCNSYPHFIKLSYDILLACCAQNSCPCTRCRER